MRPTDLKAQTCMGPRRDIFEFHTIPVVEDMRRHLNYNSGISPYYTSLWNYLTRIHWHDTFKGHTVKPLAPGQRVPRAEMRPLVSIDSSLRRLGHQPTDAVVLEISDQMVAVWKAATRQPIFKKARRGEAGRQNAQERRRGQDKRRGRVHNTERNKTWQSREGAQRRKDIGSAKPPRRHLYSCPVYSDIVAYREYCCQNVRSKPATRCRCGSVAEINAAVAVTPRYKVLRLR